MNDVVEAGRPLLVPVTAKVVVALAEFEYVLTVRVTVPPVAGFWLKVQETFGELYRPGQLVLSVTAPVKPPVRVMLTV